MGYKDKIRSKNKKIDLQKKVHNGLLKNTGNAVHYWNAISLNLEFHAKNILEFIEGRKGNKVAHWVFQKIFKKELQELRQAVVGIRVAALSGQGFAGSVQDFADKLGGVTIEEVNEGMRLLREGGILKMSDLPVKGPEGSKTEKGGTDETKNA